MVTFGQYSGTDLAPYYRFRPTPFYEAVFINGTYTADIIGCNWTCDHCWSKFGWRGLDMDRMPKGAGEFTAQQVVDKLLRGMERNGQPMARVSGGEASLYWDPHILGVIRGLLEATIGERLIVPGRTSRNGVEMGLCIETNASVLTTAALQALERELGGEARRLVLAIGMKASNAKELGRLTGMTPTTATRFHRNQMRVLRWLAFEAEYIGYFANYLDEFTDTDEYDRLVDEFETKEPGSAEFFGIDPYRRSYRSTLHYQPKRLRA